MTAKTDRTMEKILLVSTTQGMYKGTLNQKEDMSKNVAAQMNRKKLDIKYLRRSGGITNAEVLGY